MGNVGVVLDRRSGEGGLEFSYVKLVQLFDVVDHWLLGEQAFEDGLVFVCDLQKHLLPLDCVHAKKTIN